VATTATISLRLPRGTCRIPPASGTGCHRPHGSGRAVARAERHDGVEVAVETPAVLLARARRQGLAPARQEHGPQQQRLHAGREGCVTGLASELAVPELVSEADLPTVGVPSSRHFDLLRRLDRLVQPLFQGRETRRQRHHLLPKGQRSGRSSGRVTVSSDRQRRNNHSKVESRSTRPLKPSRKRSFRPQSSSHPSSGMSRYQCRSQTVRRWCHRTRQQAQLFACA